MNNPELTTAELEPVQVQEAAEAAPEATESAQTQDQPEHELIATAAVDTERTHLEEKSEAGKLCEYLENISDTFTGPDAIKQLASYFKVKGRIEMFKFGDPDQLAQEVWSIEEKVRTIKAPDGREDAIHVIRESLMSMLLSGKAGAEAILSRLNGDIVFLESPGDEIKEDGKTHVQNPEELAAYFTIGPEGSNVYLYEKFLQNNIEDPALREALQKHHFQHEMGHLFAESGAIWEREVFVDFLDAISRMDDAKIAKIGETAPELSSIYNLIKNPREAVFFRPYIRGKLNELSDLEGDALSTARATAAKEIIAEMTAFYLGSDNNELSYFNARLQMCGQDLKKLCVELSGTASYDAFLQLHNLEGRELTVEQAFELIKMVPEFRRDLTAQTRFIEKLNSAFENRGKNMPPMAQSIPAGTEIEYEDMDFSDYESLYMAGSPGSTSGGDSDVSFSSGGLQAESPLSTVWNFVTGTNNEVKLI